MKITDRRAEKTERTDVPLLAAPASAQNEPKKPPINVAVLIPTRGVMPQGFVYDTMQMMMMTMQTVVADGIADLGFIFGQNTYIHKNRQDLAEAAMRQGATHMLWLDDDMRFPPELLLRLLSHRKPIVGVNYVQRSVVGDPVTIKRIGEKGEPSERLYTLPDQTGLEAVDGIGFGAVLMTREVFTKLDRPWFENYYDREKDRWVGEDIDFCTKARAAGYEILVDHDLSQDIAHIGTFEYKMAGVLAVREAKSGTE